MRNYRDGGEAVLEAFRTLEVDYVVCSPGSEWSPMWEAITRQKLDGRDGPRYLNCNHETLAVNVATGYTTVTRKPQAVLVHAGAGLLQGSMGVQGALFAGLPMMILSGESTTYGEDPNFDPGFQWQASLSVVGGPQRFVEPLVKWASQVTSKYTLYDTVVRAGEMAQRVPTGPVYIDAPFETMLAEWTPPTNLHKPPPFERAEVSDAKIMELVQMIAAARNPVILTESAGREVEGFNALVDFAESFALPVVEVGHVQDYASFPTSHPLHQGFEVGPLVQNADLILLVRAKMPWHPPRSRPVNAKVVAIDENPLKTYMVYQSLQADMYLEGDMTSSLTRLAAALRNIPKADAIAGRLAHWTEASQKRKSIIAAKEAEARGKKPVDPVSLCVALRETMPDDVAYVDETTTHRGLVQRHVGWERPHSYFYVHGGLGQGLGMSIGVKLAMPDRPIVNLIGDGAFMYNPTNPAYGLARSAKTPFMTVIFNNSVYAAMRNNQRRYFPDGAGFADNTFHGGEVQGFDYSELAKLFDGYGERVDDPAEVHAALARGLKAVRDGRIAIINVMLSY